MRDWFRRPEREDVKITFPGVELAFNHRLKIAFLYEQDTSMPDNRYVDLERHLSKRGYFLQVIVAPTGMPFTIERT